MGCCPSNTIQPTTSPNLNCQRQVCFNYLIKLHLKKNNFNPKFNVCYCQGCYSTSTTCVGDAAGTKYTIPTGWTAFGLKIDRKVITGQKIFQNWAITFYGTPSEKLHDILRNRFIPFPGDKLLSGKTFEVSLPDQSHVYTSPSINYASLSHVCPTEEVKIGQDLYKFQTVLLCRQDPNGVQKGRSGKPNVCQFIPNETIQWKTNRRSTIVPCQLLIRATKC